jgi:hypothetical protein
MKRLTALGALGLALFLAPAVPAAADRHLPGQQPAPAPAPAAAPARAGGPELMLVAGVLGALGASAVGGGVLLRRRKDGD